MKSMHIYIQVVGGLLAATGIVGVFSRISSNDGALAVAGAILFSAGMVCETLVRRRP